MEKTKRVHQHFTHSRPTSPVPSNGGQFHADPIRLVRKGFRITHRAMRKPRGRHSFFASRIRPPTNGAESSRQTDGEIERGYPHLRLLTPRVAWISVGRPRKCPEESDKIPIIAAITAH